MNRNCLQISCTVHPRGCSGFAWDYQTLWRRPPRGTYRSSPARLRGLAGGSLGARVRNLLGVDHEPPEERLPNVMCHAACSAKKLAGDVQGRHVP
jgi:hypothetical protein